MASGTCRTEMSGFQLMEDSDALEDFITCLLATHLDGVGCCIVDELSRA